MDDQKIKTSACEIFGALTKDELDYISDPERGEYIGFAALHDLCDANMLLPDPDYDTYTDDGARFCEVSNKIIDHFNALIHVEIESRKAGEKVEGDE